MIDFHSHILPNIDDGSSSVQESIEMLRLSKEMGIRTMVATPHFYASKESPDSFLRRRNEAWEKLREHVTEDLPEVVLGAEVYYYEGMQNTEELSRLCIQGTRVMLLEMPFRKWSDRMVNDILSIADNRGITIVLAHIDRYLHTQNKNVWEELEENRMLFQVNASFFLDGWMSRRKAMKLLKDERVDVLGSDCHNMKDRRPNVAAAYELIAKKAGDEEMGQLIHHAEQLLRLKY